MTIMMKDISGKIDLPREWDIKYPSDLPGENLKLTPQERIWLERHDHFHGDREILAVISGRALLRLDGRPVRISRGEFLVIDPWVRHTSGHLPDEAAVFWWCMLLPGRFRCLLWRRNRIDSYQVIQSEEFVQLLNQTFSGRVTAAAGELQHFIGGLICRFTRLMDDQNPLAADSLHHETAVQKVLSWLENLPVLKCSLSEAAALAGYSQTHFQRLFKQMTGKSFYDYLQRRRLERYHNLRDKKNIIKKELANLLGFASTAALNHWERRIRAAARKKPRR